MTAPFDVPLRALAAWRLQVPLAQPYKLAFGPVTHYDTLLVRATAADGATGWGEATLLTGYTDETIDGAWQEACAVVQAVAHGAALQPELAARAAAQPFLATAFVTALEMAAGSARLQPPAQTVRVPILGLLQGASRVEIADATDRLLEAGFGTFKLKVGFDPAGDADFVATAQAVVRGRARLRIDANQGFDAAQARDFVGRLRADDIELFEQPCAAGDWDAHLAVVPVARARGVPLMLDESIYALADIERAAQLGAAQFVKVKLMKFVSLTDLDAALARIRALGMAPVLGNGVANDLGCWMEACAAVGRIDNAGENNGFLKPVGYLFAAPLPFARGAIELRPDWRPQIDLAAVERFARDRIDTASPHAALAVASPSTVAPRAAPAAASPTLVAPGAAFARVPSAPHRSTS